MSENNILSLNQNEEKKVTPNEALQLVHKEMTSTEIIHTLEEVYNVDPMVSFLENKLGEKLSITL